MLLLKIRLNRYFAHIFLQLLLHLIFTIAFGSLFTSTENQKTDDDEILILFAGITFIYNLIATGTSLFGLVVIEFMNRKTKFTERAMKIVLMGIRICVIISQILNFITCIIMGVAFSRKSGCSETFEPLLNLGLAYCIIGLWYIILSFLFLTSGHCIWKNFKKNKENPIPMNTF